MNTNFRYYVKFYGANDLSTPIQLERATKVLDGFSQDKQYDSINDIIELYNIDKLISSGCCLYSWTGEQLEGYKQVLPSFKGIIGKFFSKIDDKNFIDIIESVDSVYIADFFDLFQKHKVFNRVSPDVFAKCLELSIVGLEDVLKHEKVVNHYDESLASFMLQSEQSASLLANKFLSSDGGEFFIPKSLLPNKQEFNEQNAKKVESIFLRYINSQDSSLKILQLIIEGKSSKDCPISDKLRYLARQAFNESFKKLSSIRKPWVSVSFEQQSELKNYVVNEDNLRVSYDVSWLKASLDNPSIMNNFINVFDMFDSCCRSNLVSLSSQINAIEMDAFILKGKAFYPIGDMFSIKNMLAVSQTMLYCNFLKANNICLEEVFKWFFEVYLPEEFCVHGFSMLLTSQSASWVEKIRNMAIEIEGALKRFKLFVQEGEIEQGLYEETSGHLLFSDVPSLIQNKYVYPKGERIQKAMYLLCDEQSLLAYSVRTGSKYKTFYQMLSEEKVVKLSDFNVSQIPNIQFLIDFGVVLRTKEDFIDVDVNKAFLLYELYENEVVCAYYYPFLNTTIDKMVSSKDLTRDSALFSNPEQSYLNYMLNKAEFSNGLDLRNKYLHGIYPKDEAQQTLDYVHLLILMILVITKINDEFCMRDLLAKEQSK